MERTYNPCAECPYGIDMRDGSGSDAMCQICEFEELLGIIMRTNFGRLREICEAERDGRCVVLPCKVGDTVWVIDRSPYYATCTTPCKISMLQQKADFSWKIRISHPKYGVYDRGIDSIGKTIFLTSEYAKAAKGGAE